MKDDCLKYKITFFNVYENEDKIKLFDNYLDWSKLYYILLGKTWVKDLQAFKFDSKLKNYREVYNV